MTQSGGYFETIGRQAGMTPQVDDKMAYADTEGSQVDNVGTQAKELEKIILTLYSRESMTSMLNTVET